MHLCVDLYMWIQIQKHRYMQTGDDLVCCAGLENCGSTTLTPSASVERHLTTPCLIGLRLSNSQTTLVWIAAPLCDLNSQPAGVIMAPASTKRGDHFQSWEIIDVLTSLMTLRGSERLCSDAQSRSIEWAHCKGSICTWCEWIGPGLGYFESNDVGGNASAYNQKLASDPTNTPQYISKLLDRSENSPQATYTALSIYQMFFSVYSSKRFSSLLKILLSRISCSPSLLPSMPLLRSYLSEVIKHNLTDANEDHEPWYMRRHPENLKPFPMASEGQAPCSLSYSLMRHLPIKMALTKHKSLRVFQHTGL